MLYREWTSRVNMRRGRMVTLETLQSLLKQHDPGYASVYCFGPEAALEIKANGHSGGMDKYPVMSSSLTIDIDTGDYGLEVAKKAIKGLAHEIWSSGGKGYHVVIPHDPLESINLPYSHWKVVEGMGLAKVADKSIYRHGSLISLPGRVHSKTKNKKVLISTTEGDPIKVPILVKPIKTIDSRVDGDLDELSQGLMCFINMILQEPTPGNRHVRLWGAAKDMAAAGMSYNTILEIALGVNSTWENRKTEEEVALAIAQALQG